MLLQYETGIRVVILTSNMIESDWNQKTQAIWMSDLLPPLPSDALSVDTSKTHFKTDLLEYLQTYRLPSINFWIALIKRHDFSSVNVFLIGSVPGTHSGPKLNSFGHMKLRQLLRQHCPASITSNWGTVAQFSSIGSLGKKPDQWLTGEFEQTLNTTKSNRLASKSAIKLVFPTVENVRKSLEGYIAGRSLPYRKEIDDRQLYLRSFMHKWSSNHINRSRASPHIKSYFRHSPEYSKVAWFVLTSANLSKAAWGQLQKKGVQLSILSYELGVLFVPSMFVSEIKNEFVYN